MHISKVGRIRLKPVCYRIERGDTYEIQRNGAPKIFGSRDGDNRPSKTKILQKGEAKGQIKAYFGRAKASRSY